MYQCLSEFEASCWIVHPIIVADGKNRHPPRALACRVLSPSLLTCLYDFVHVPRFGDSDAAELFLSFGIGTIRRCDFAVLPIQSQGGFRRLKRCFPTTCPLARRWSLYSQHRRTWRVARPRSWLRVCLCRSIPNRRISWFFSSG